VGVDMKEIFVSDIGYGSDGLLVKDDVNSISDLRENRLSRNGLPVSFLV